MRKEDGPRVVLPHLLRFESHTQCVKAFPRGGLTLFIVTRPGLMAPDTPLSASGWHSPASNYTISPNGD